MFTLQFSGTITRVFAPDKNNPEHAVVIVHEDYWRDGEVCYRVWHVHVTKDEFQRRIKLCVDGRRIGADCYDINATMDFNDKDNQLIYQARARRLFVL